MIIAGVNIQATQVAITSDVTPGDTKDFTLTANIQVNTGDTAG